MRVKATLIIVCAVLLLSLASLLMPVFDNVSEVVAAEAPSTEWSLFPGPGAVSCVQQTADGGYIALISRYLWGTGGCEGYLLKLDSLGSQEWMSPLPANCWHFLEQTSDGGYIIVGNTSTGNDSDICLMKATSTGDMSWIKTFGGDGYDGAGEVHQTVDGGYIIVGSEAGLTAAFLVKTDSNGNVLWHSTLTTESGERPAFAASVEQTTDGGYIVAGFFC